jgi:hypothetical protein
MSYQPNIPQSNQLLSLSQLDLLTNFQQLNTIFGNVDHVAYYPATSNSGKHNKSTYVQQASDPSTAAAEGAVYTKSIGGNPTLVYRNQSNGSIVPLLPIVTSTSLNIGGLIFQWATVPLTLPSSANSGTISFSTPFPNNCYIVIANTNGPGTQTFGGATSSFTVNNFVCSGLAGGTVNINYLAIGN